MYYKDFRSVIDALEAAHKKSRDSSNNPQDTAREFIRTVGAETATQCMAAMIRRLHWDGRISRQALQWAESVALSADWERRMDEACSGIIHTAHLSQIAEAMPAALAEGQKQKHEAEKAQKPALTVEAIRERVNANKPRSAWDRGVLQYADELLDSLDEAIDGGYFYSDDLGSPKVLEKCLLNGASSWSAYSWGGCSLCYDSEIAERLCTPSELKRKRGGDLRPNKSEEWLDTQARALFQAAHRITAAARILAKEEGRPL